MHLGGSVTRLHMQPAMHEAASESRPQLALDLNRRRCRSAVSLGNARREHERSRHRPALLRWASARPCSAQRASAACHSISLASMIDAAIGCG